ncbi:DUF1659 domain-containing protein [Ureibacillus sp. FSL E2-3493]|uniref:DUF1659 domain-containing protein n=1 Tax=Ureibacillus sp. FSL E2-3493 TaxID=2921367 RepID=UPI003119EFDF
MAAYNFENATLKLSFETGVDEQGKPIITSKTYRNVRANVEASQIAAVVQVLASLSNYTLQKAQKIETESVEL